MVAVLECRYGGAEIARVGEAIGADRAEIGQTEERPVILADIAPRPVIDEVDAEFDAARHDGDLARTRLDHPELGGEQQTSRLWQDQQLPVSVVKDAALHR